MSDDARTWRANPGPQERFLASGAYEVLYGGAAGGGKSESLLMAALRHVDKPGYRALLLRRTFTELFRSLIERSYQWYPAAGGRPLMSPQPQWRFLSGAVIEFGHLQHEHDVHAYQSAEYQFIGFDELTSFTEHQYVYMLSRARSTSGIPVRIRSATNPGGEGHEWVKRRWAPWLDPDSQLKAAPGCSLYYVNTDDGERWVEKGAEFALSRLFIPARVTDNPHLMAGDPGYVERLKGLDPLSRAQLLDGDWLARPAAGMFFKRGWFDVVDAVPGPARRVRYWDRAATKDDGDWTVGLRLAALDGVYYVEDVVRLRGTPHEVEQAVTATAALDGGDVMIGIEKDPGQAGVFEADYYVRALAGYNVRTFPVTKSKVTRAQPVSAQAEARNVKLVRGPWNLAFLQELEEFPDGGHDDQVDALSGAFAAASVPVMRAGTSSPAFLDY